MTSQGSLNIAKDPFPLAAAMVVMDFAVKWMCAKTTKNPSRRNTITTNLDLTTYDEREFLSSPNLSAACYTVASTIVDQSMSLEIRA